MVITSWAQRRVHLCLYVLLLCCKCDTQSGHHVLMSVDMRNVSTGRDLAILRELSLIGQPVWTWFLRVLVISQIQQLSCKVTYIWQQKDFTQFWQCTPNCPCNLDGERVSAKNRHHLVWIQTNRQVQHIFRWLVSIAVFRQGSKPPICPSFWRLSPRF